MRWHHSHTVNYSCWSVYISISNGSNQNKQEGCVILMWLAALSSVSLVLWCGCTVLWRNPLAFKTTTTTTTTTNGNSW